MPYVITTKREIGPHEGDKWPVESRRAVATLEEARSRIRIAIHDAYPAFTPVPPSARPFFAQAHELGARSGGTVGPLPDGTVIEVESTNWYDLNHAAGLTLDDTVGDGVGRYTPDDEAKIIDAYNARS